MNNVVFGDPEGSSTRAATNDEKIKWPNGVIPYEFDCSVGTCPLVIQRINMSSIPSGELSPVSVEVRSRCRGKSLIFLSEESMTSSIVIT